MVRTCTTDQTIIEALTACLNGISLLFKVYFKTIDLNGLG
jgi:hypothetical protein